MRSRKLLATMTLVALLGSDFVLAAFPAAGQTPTQGNGYPMTPTPNLGGADGAYGRVLPGPSTTAPYVGAPLQVLPPTPPQMIQRPAGPAEASRSPGRSGCARLACRLSGRSRRPIAWRRSA